MTTHGGRREGAGRKPRQEAKSYPIWCGQMSEEDRALILETLTPQERFDALMYAIEYKEGQEFIDRWLKGEDDGIKRVVDND